MKPDLRPDQSINETRSETNEIFFLHRSNPNPNPTKNSTAEQSREDPRRIVWPISKGARVPSANALDNVDSPLYFKEVTQGRTSIARGDDISVVEAFRSKATTSQSSGY
ncbi:hypothetical protein U1Q18_034013 [Sarracenia purpurea var. burkii]